jgi:hypothetical protein
VGSALKFTPITVVWRSLHYYVSVPKGLTGAAALNVMPSDAPEEIAGKKRLLNRITGVFRCKHFLSIHTSTVART